MKLKFSISIFLGLLITGSAVMAATSASASKRATVDTRSSDNARYAVGAFMGYGLDARGERSQDQSVLARPYHSVVLGFARGPWLTSLEYGTFSESSGNETLSVERQAETVLWWNSWRAEDLRIVQPYMGLGVGASRDKAESLLFSNRRTALSMGAGSNSRLA